MTGHWLPEDLRGRALSIEDLRAAGVPAWRLRAPHLHRPTRGARCSEAPDGLSALAAAFAPALPADVAYSHATAAALWEIPLPGALVARPGLDVIRPTAAAQTRRAGVRGHRGLERRSLWTIHGLPVVGLADTWCDLGELDPGLLGLDDLVAAGDEVVRQVDALAALPSWADEDARSGTRLLRPAPGLRSVPLLGSPGLGELRATLEARTRPRGAARLRRALRLVRPGVRSPRETRARLLFLRAGFPEPEVNAVVRSDAGDFLLMGDLVWRAQRVVGEYQGAHHASRRQHSKDRDRAARAADHGWTLLEIFAEDVDPGPRQERLLCRFARHLGCPVRPTDIE